MTGRQLNSQAERTALAWNRTLLAFAGVIGIIAMHAAINDQPTLFVSAIVVVAGLLILLAWIASRRVWTRATDAMSGARRAASPTSLLLLSLACVAVAVIGLLLAVLPEGLPS